MVRLLGGMKQTLTEEEFLRFWLDLAGLDADVIVGMAPIDVARSRKEGRG